MPSPNTAEAEFEESEEAELAKLSARVTQLSQLKEAKSKAAAAIAILRDRYSKKKKPSHPCGDVLPYRYLSNQKYDLRRNVVSVLTFAHLARYLTKTQIENIAKYRPSLEQAKLILKTEKDFPPDWWDCYMNWKKSNRKLALYFFIEVTNEIKAGEADAIRAKEGDEELKLPDDGEIGSDCPTLVGVTTSLPGRKRPRIELPGTEEERAEPGQARTKTNTYIGDAFIVDIDDARQALSHDEHVGEVWLTNPESKYNANDEKKRSFLTLWLSEAMGQKLARRSKPMIA